MVPSDEFRKRFWQSPSGHERGAYGRMIKSQDFTFDFARKLEFTRAAFEDLAAFVRRADEHDQTSDVMEQSANE